MKKKNLKDRRQEPVISCINSKTKKKSGIVITMVSACENVKVLSDKRWQEI